MAGAEPASGAVGVVVGAGVVVGVCAGAGEGRRSGPLMPQPPTAIAATAHAAAMRRRPVAPAAATESRNIAWNPSMRELPGSAMSTDSEFMAAADRVLAAIGKALDVALDEGDVDADWTLKDGILEIECADGSKVVVNRHVPNREIWVAARSGGFHFAAREGAWRDTRSGAELGASLSNLLRAQAGLEVALPALATPP